MLFAAPSVKEKRSSTRTRPKQKESIKEMVLAKLEEITGCRPDPDFISDQGNDLCVGCGTDSQVSALQHIDERPHYVGGVGQYCEDCCTVK